MLRHLALKQWHGRAIVNQLPDRGIVIYEPWFAVSRGMHLGLINLPIIIAIQTEIC